MSAHSRTAPRRRRRAAKQPEPGDSRERSLRSLPLRIARATSAVVGFVATLLSVIFVLVPASLPEGPPEDKGADLSRATAQWLSFGQYLDRTDTGAAGHDASALRRRGLLVEFDFAIDGYKKEPLRLRYGLVDAAGGEQLDKSSDTEFEPQTTRERGSFPLWIPRPARRAKRVYVQVQLFARDADTAIGRVRTPVLRG